MSEAIPSQKIILPRHLYGISQTVAQSGDWKIALDEIAIQVRSIFIFDNLVVYRWNAAEQTLEAISAKAVGRGRSAGADAAWGETLANQVMASQQTTLNEPTQPLTDRIASPYLLGIPLKVVDTLVGVIVFIRFGGPSFAPETVSLGEFIAQQVALLIEREIRLEEYRELEVQHQQTRLQNDFISTISHELRSPLGFIKGYTTTLLRSDTQWDQATQNEFLTIIDHATDRLEELIGNLLDSARLQSGQMKMQFQPVRLEALLNDVMTRNRHHQPEQIVRLDIPGVLAPVQADPTRLAQVIENLLGNAHKYARGAEVVIKVKEDSAGTTISIHDFGPGIKQEYLTHIFERFWRTPEAQNAQGSGLGLYICKQIIDAHHGKIWAESAENQGTTIQIFLPNLD